MICAKCTMPGLHATPSKKFFYCETHAYCPRCNAPVETFVLALIAQGLSLWVCPCITTEDQIISLADAVRLYDEREERTTEGKVRQVRSRKEETLWNT